MLLNRLVISALAYIPYVLSQNPVQCDTIRVRRSAHSLSRQEWSSIGKVVSKMNRNGQLRRFAQSHQAVFDSVHGNSMFFPFHRRFIQEFEDMGRQIDPTFSIPYWDATRDYRDPAQSPILQSFSLGGNGQGPSRCLPDGIQGNSRMQFPQRHCLRRDFNDGNHILPWVSPEVISSFLQFYDNLSDFREHIEYSIHGVVHLGLGGDAATRFAPNDIFFFMHHANIDRLWWLWQTGHNAIWDYNGPGPNGMPSSLDDVIPDDQAINFGGEPVGATMVLGFNGMCYAYDSAPPPPDQYPGLGSGGGGAQLLRAFNASSVLSGSSRMDAHGVEIARISKALGGNKELQKYFPKIAHMKKSIKEAIMEEQPTILPYREVTDKCAYRRQHYIPYPMRMSEAWIKMHKFDPWRVEQTHRGACRLIDLLNNSTYVSPY